MTDLESNIDAYTEQYQSLCTRQRSDLRVSTRVTDVHALKVLGNLLSATNIPHSGLNFRPAAHHILPQAHNPYTTYDFDKCLTA